MLDRVLNTPLKWISTGRKGSRKEKTTREPKQQKYILAAQKT